MARIGLPKEIRYKIKNMERNETETENFYKLELIENVNGEIIQQELVIDLWMIKNRLIGEGKTSEEILKQIENEKSKGRSDLYRNFARRKNFELKY